MFEKKESIVLLEGETSLMDTLIAVDKISYIDFGERKAIIYFSSEGHYKKVLYENKAEAIKFWKSKLQK
jgi:hypothetical protein